MTNPEVREVNEVKGAPFVFTVSKLLVLIAVLCAVLAAFHVALPADLLALAIAFGFASFLVP